MPQRPSPYKLLRLVTTITTAVLVTNTVIHNAEATSAASSIISGNIRNKVSATTFLRSPHRDTQQNRASQPSALKKGAGIYSRKGNTDHTSINAIVTTSSTTSDPRYNNPDPTPPSLEKMRSQLGPFGRLVANSVEVGVTTAGSYMSGGAFGYVAGGIMGVPTLFRNSPPTPPTSPRTIGVVAKIPPPPPLPPIDPNTGKEVGMSLAKRLKAINTRAVAQGASWGQLSAAFSGFHALTRVCRGGVEDKWNGIIGSACTGAYLSRAGGPSAMAQGAATYSGFTYLIDVVFGSEDRSKKGKDEEEFDFSDTPLV